MRNERRRSREWVFWVRMRKNISISCIYSRVYKQIHAVIICCVCVEFHSTTPARRTIACRDDTDGDDTYELQLWNLIFSFFQCLNWCFVVWWLEIVCVIFGMSKRDVDYFSGLAHKKKLLVMVKQHCFSVDVVVAVQQRMKYAINPNEICVVKIHVLFLARSA